MAKEKLTRKEKVKRSQLQGQLRKSKAERKYALGLILGGIVFILFFGNMWINRNQITAKDELTTIEGTLSNKLELRRKKAIGNSVVIRLNEYPKIDFKVERFGITGLKLKSLQDNVKMGDKIQIDILKDAHLNVGFNDINKISIYGLRNDKLEFLNVKSHNEARNKDRNSISAYLILGFSFLALGYGIYLRIKTEKIN